MSAGEPTAFLVSAPDGKEVERGLALKGTFGGPDPHPDVVWIGLPAYPGSRPRAAADAVWLVGAGRREPGRRRRRRRTARNAGERVCARPRGDRA